MTENIFKTAHTTSLSVPKIVEELSNIIIEESAPPSLAILFASHDHADSLVEIIAGLSQRIDTSRLIGCTGVAIVSDDQEYEDKPCVVMWAAWLPSAEIELMHLRFERTLDGHAFSGWLDGLRWSEDTSLIQLAEPYSFPADVFLEQINQDHPQTPVVGGMASGGAGPGESKLILGNRVLQEGAVVAMLRGVAITPIVSQGCRPVGEPLVITKAERNVIYELGGKPAYAQLQAIYDQLPNRDKALMRQGLHIGRVINEYQDRFEYGDFLIRNVSGLNQEDGSILVGDFMRVGQTMQFHLRDASTASEDLRAMLQRADDGNPQAALLFTCNGRGTRLFDEPHHDANMVSRHSGSLIPTAGFFCQGEIGPVGGVNFLHGFTASVVLFR